MLQLLFLLILDDKKQNGLTVLSAGKPDTRERPYLRLISLARAV